MFQLSCSERRRAPLQTFTLNFRSHHGDLHLILIRVFHAQRVISEFAGKGRRYAAAARWKVQETEAGASGSQFIHEFV